MKPILRTTISLSLALLAGFALLAAPTAHAQINYQGSLTNSAGAPLPDGQYDITFRLWTSVTGGSQIWGPYIADGAVTTGHGPKADVVNGRFNVIIGGTAVGGGSLTTAMSANPTAYLEIKVGTNAAISPRQIILPAPRSLSADVIPNVTPTGNTTRITGNVGIGPTAFTPTQLLEVNGNVSAGGLASASHFLITGNQIQQYSGASVATMHLNFSGGGVTMAASGGGNVGVGTSGTSAKLHANVTAAEAIPGFRVQVDGSSKFTVGSNGGTSIGGFNDTPPANGLYVAGNVGIGTTPTRGKLDVAGFQSYSYNIGGFLNRNGASDLTNTDITRNVGIYSDNHIVGVEIHANSDARIKNILGRSDGAVDLTELMRIEITNYTHKDVIARGDAVHKKVIAQQVEKVLPQAVNQQLNVVPDIYQKAPIANGWIELATDLKLGERVRLVGDQKQAVHEVLEVAQDKFRVDFVPDSETVFVYGREVNDFRTVDYDAIAMLNVSATQQIKKEKDAEVKALQEENAVLKAALANQDKRVTTLEAKDKARDAKMASIEKRLESPEHPATRTVSFKAE